jgi:hypothetical protein
MRPIDKFILHVVHNWRNKLNEAYSEKAIQGFINKFKEEADDLNISITDNQLRAYINNFDRIKEKLPSDQRDLAKWNIGNLIRLVTTGKGGEEAAEEVDLTPDVVYNNENNTIVIYNGSKEANCINYGEGEKWCITRSSFSSYRYNEQKSFPTFYLAKNNNLPRTDKLSFVAIQVRDPSTTNENNRYVYTNRINQPYESNPMSFEGLLSEVPWLRDVPNIKSVLKYIPITPQEKMTQRYKGNSTFYKEWVKFPYSAKEQYLTVRRGNELFSDIKNSEFVEKYLPKYPDIAKFIAETPGIINPLELLKHLDKFPNQIRRSITANLRDKINLRYIPLETLPFDVKKLLVQLNKWELLPNERLYVTKDGSTIVNLTLGKDIRLDLYQAEDNYPNIKLNKRTSKYLLDYQELDKIPLRNLLKLAEDEIIDKNLITKVLDDAKKDSNSAILVKPVENGEIILDSNSFSSYKIDDNGKISAVPFDNEEVQQIFNDAKDNESFQQNALNLFKRNDNIFPTIDKGALKNIINSIPSSKRIIQLPREEPTVVLTADGPIPFFIMWANPNSFSNYLTPVSKYDEEGRITMRGDISNEMMTSYFNYLRQTNKSFNDDELLGILKSAVNIESKRVFARNNPPVNANNRYRVVEREGEVYVVNTQNTRESFMLSSSRNNLKQASISTPLAAQLLGRQPQQAPGQAVAQANDAIRAARRGRPAGAPNAPRQQQVQPAIPAGQGVSLTNIANTLNLTQGFNALPRLVLRKFNMDGRQLPATNDRGASRRNNMLGNAGRVTAVYEFGPSSVYIIQLANNTRVASIVVQPGNSHYIITNNAAIQLGSPAGLLQALQQRNLAEIHRYIVNEYFDRNPKHITEFKQLLRKHINEKKMDKSKLKEIIRGIVDKVLAENAPAPAKPKEKPGPEVAPGKPDTGKPKPRRPLGNPTTAPKVSPKAEGLNEEEMLNKIVARFKSKK